MKRIGLMVVALVIVTFAAYDARVLRSMRASRLAAGESEFDKKRSRKIT